MSLYCIDCLAENMDPDAEVAEDAVTIANGNALCWRHAAEYCLAQARAKIREILD